MNKRGLATLLGVEVVSLSVVSALHFADAMPGHTKNFNATSAGTAEAVIGVVLAVALARLIRVGNAARSFVLGAVGFGIVGFLVGLTFTIRGGALADLTYHATMLPILLATAFAAWRMPADREKTAAVRL